MPHSLSTREWAAERLDNSLRIAESKSGTDRDGWLEDADYFRKIGSTLDADADLRGVVAAMAISGPDDDGLLWLMFSAPAGGPKGALSVKANSLAGRALSEWRDARDAALATAAACAPGERP